MAQPHKIPMLGALQQMGSNGSGLSLRQNNRGASYFRLESSPRQGAPQVPDTTQAPVAPAVTLSFDLSTELYNRLDDMKRWAWIPDEAEGYVVAEIVSTSGSTVSVITLSGESRSLDRATSEVIEFKRDTIRHIVDDLVRLEDMNIPTIMMNLKERAKRDLIYTNVGSILVSVNPYQMLPIYTPAVMEQYRRQIPNLPPHPFSVADQCYRALFEEKKNQAILVSGESGAGKTEAVKVVLQYLAEAAGSSSGVEQKILLANPILEAFGNAKTIRNNNSSRFGKWVEIHFSSGRIIGAKTTNYLLEKTRVVQQAATERNYHIFYQLVAYANAEGAANAELKTSLGLGTASEYAFMSSGGCYTIPGVDDVDEFKQTMKAMKQLQFDEVQIGVVFKIIAAILHLGNVNFDRESDEKAKVSPSTQPSLVKAAQLLAVNPKELEKALTTRSILIMNETTEIPLNDLKARESRDSLAKFLYGELFDWLVQMINGALAGTAKGPVQFIGVLDIFGFEIFQHNSFEQLCINFTNEKMQQMFNSSIFKEEEAIYRAEGINHESVTFVDNQVVLDLIEKKPTGLLPMLDEEIRMPKATDKTFLDKISGQHKEAANFSRPVKIANSFTVQHYAGHVTYNVEGFLDKNRDTMFDDLIRVIQSTKIPTIKTIVTAKEVPQAAASGPSKKAAARSLASQFVAQLKDLNDTIAATSSHYIRCIKPNTEFKPCSSLFDTPMSLRQLRYAGVFEAVAIRKNGFPYRLTYEDFVKRFYMISKSPLGTIHGIPREEAKSKVELIAEAMGDFRARLQFGQSLVFYKADELKRLEEYRSSAMKGKVVLVQTLWRGARARRQFAKLAAIRSGLISAMEKRTVEALEEALGASLEVDWELREAAQARVMLTRVKLEAKLIARIVMVFSNPESLGELNQQQEEKAQEFLDEAAEMTPPFEHEKLSSLVAMMKKSEKLREERLEAEAAAERERLARRTEEERLAAEQAAAKEAERLATEQNKKKLAEQFHLSAWQGEESENEKTKNALEVLFVEKVPTPRQRSASIVEFDPEAMALAEPQTRQRSATLEARDAAALAAALEAEKADEMAKDAARMAQLSMDELNKIERVKNRLLEATSAAPYTIFDGVMFMPDGTVMVSMQANQALKSAIIAAQQIGAFDSPDKELRKAIYTAQMLMGIRMDAANENWEGIRNRIEGAQGSTSGFIEVPEISAARLLSSKNDIADKLEAAAAARDEPMLRQLLIEAKSTSYDASAYEAVHQALVDLLAFVEASLAANDYVKIQSAIQALEQLGIPKYLVPYHDRCQSAIAARKPVLENMIRKALNEMPDRVELASLQTQASVLNIKSTDTERLAEIVSLNGEKLCRLQLEAAKTMANEERIWQLNLELKGHLLERFAKKLTYQDAPSLKTPAEFASGKVFGKDKVMDGLLAWTSTPIHAALTRDLDKKSEEQSTKLFRNVMGWMGDRHYSYTVTLIQEIINKVVSVAALRDEIYAQVIKQLTNNPSADSMKRGWQLLLVLLMSVPPSPKFENYVGAWLLINGQSYHIHELHETIFKGALPQPPTLPEIIYILYHLPPTPGESYASAKTVTLEQAQKSGVDLSNPLATPAMDRFDKHATLRGHKDNIKKERKRISDMRPPKRK